jgi:hypothetical protein
MAPVSLAGDSLITPLRSRDGYRPLRKNECSLNSAIGCLSCRNLTIDVSSRSGILTLSPHVTILLILLRLTCTLLGAYFTGISCADIRIASYASRYNKLSANVLLYGEVFMF